MNTILQKRIEEVAQKELAQKYFPNEMNIWARPNYEAQYVESACKEIATFALQNQWISVEEALPDDDENVLLLLDDGHIIVAYHSGNYWWWCDGFVCGTKTNGQPMYSSSQRVDDKPTHWMMIPPLEGGE